jgi:hypothetical protein
MPDCPSPHNSNRDDGTNRRLPIRAKQERGENGRIGHHERFVDSGRGANAADFSAHALDAPFKGHKEGAQEQRAKDRHRIESIAVRWNAKPHNKSGGQRHVRDEQVIGRAADEILSLGRVAFPFLVGQ